MLANRNESRAVGNEMERLCVEFVTNGAAPVSSAKARGNSVRRIQRTGVGTYTVTFRTGAIPSEATIFSRRASFSDAATIDRGVTVGTIAFSANGEATVPLSLFTASTGAAVEGAAGNRISLTIDIDYMPLGVTPDTLD